MRKKYIVIGVIAIFIIAIIPTFINLMQTQRLISKIEKTGEVNENDISEILEIFTDPNISNDDKKELKKFIEEYPELFVQPSNFNNEENFKFIKTDCEVVIQNVLAYINSEPCEQPFCINLYEKDNKAILMGFGLDEEYELLELDISVYQSMKRIETYFLEKGYTFSAIRIVEDTICFNAIDGQYSIMYTIDGISPEDKGLDRIRNRQYDIVHIDGSWYYSIFDKYIN